MKEANPFSHGRCRSPLSSGGSGCGYEDGPLMVVKEERLSSVVISSPSEQLCVDTGGHRMHAITANRHFRSIPGSVKRLLRKGRTGSTRGHSQIISHSSHYVR
jgi:hypothetical protein